MRKIKVVFLEPFKVAEVREIDASLEGMQKAVRGCIEAAYYFEGTECVICNDEGKINGMSLNRGVYADDGSLIDIIAGPAFICDCSGENFDSLSDELIEKYLEEFRYPEVFFNIKGEITGIKIID